MVGFRSRHAGLGVESVGPVVSRAGSVLFHPMRDGHAVIAHRCLVFEQMAATGLSCKSGAACSPLDRDENLILGRFLAFVALMFSSTGYELGFILVHFLLFLPDTMPRAGRGWDYATQPSSSALSSFKAIEMASCSVSAS